MRRLILTAAIVSGLLAGPAQAGLGDLAKTVLGRGAVLQRGADACPNRLGLSERDTLTLSLARQAAQAALPGEQFLAIDTMANSSAVTESQRPGFCTQTSKKKDAMLKAIRDAAKKLATGRLGL